MNRKLHRSFQSSVFIVSGSAPEQSLEEALSTGVRPRKKRKRKNKDIISIKWHIIQPSARFCSQILSSPIWCYWDKSKGLLPKPLASLEHVEECRGGGGGKCKNTEDRKHKLSIVQNWGFRTSLSIPNCLWFLNISLTFSGTFAGTWREFQLYFLNQRLVRSKGIKWRRNFTKPLTSRMRISHVVWKPWAIILLPFPF